MKTDKELFKALVKHYQYVNEEQVFIEFADSYIYIHWHNYMDKYIRMDRVSQIAQYIKAHRDSRDQRIIKDAFGYAY